MWAQGILMRGCADCLLLLSSFAFVLVLLEPVCCGREQSTSAEGTGLRSSIVLTQFLADNPELPGGTVVGRADRGVCRLIVVRPNGSSVVLSDHLHSACEPEVSFDGMRILFAGKRDVYSRWQIFEINVQDWHIRQVTSAQLNCRSPSYQGKLYTIVSSEPWYQLVFVGYSDGILNEYGSGLAGNLYSCSLKGGDVRRLTYNLSSDYDPVIQPDGRVLFAGWQRSRLKYGVTGRVSLFGINIDGTDYAAFSTEEGKRFKRMPCITTEGLAVFIEAETLSPDGEGTLAGVTLRRPLHSYRPITEPSDGFFHSPSPLPGGDILVSRRPQNGVGTYAVVRLKPYSGEYEPVFDDPNYHDVEAVLLHARPEPDGRSSVVNTAAPNAKLYCLDTRISDLYESGRMPSGAAKTLRVLKGIQVVQQDAARNVRGDAAIAKRRILGEVPIGSDGSFNIEIPANIPIELQLLDEQGMALHSCGWIWARNKEPRGCIGCHEDGELTPENSLVEAVSGSAVKLTRPPNPTVDFCNDIMPVVVNKCAGCHSCDDRPPRLPSSEAEAFVAYTSLLAGSSRSGKGKYVHIGQARTSPLIWHIVGKDSFCMDEISGAPLNPMPPIETAQLTDQQKQTFIKWIDLGAMWDATEPSKE